MIYLIDKNPIPLVLKENSKQKGKDEYELDLSIWTGKLSMGRVYSNSDKIQVKCISGLGKIWVSIFRLHGFQIDPTSLYITPFCGLFPFCQS